MVFFCMVLYMVLAACHFMFVIVSRGKLRNFRDYDWDEDTVVIAVMTSIFFVFCVWFTVPLYLYRLRTEKHW